MSTTTLPAAHDLPLTPPRRRNGILKLIAVGKFLKAGLMLGVGLGALDLLRPDVAALLQAWAAALTTTTLHSLERNLVDWATDLPPSELETVGVLAFLLATLFTVEGVGLWLARRWAEYLTVLATLSLVPVEIYELYERHTLLRLAALTINLLVAAYLIYRLRRHE
jgi:uncharacterized membrane protein (DUF2068 family)